MVKTVTSISNTKYSSISFKYSLVLLLLCVVTSSHVYAETFKIGFISSNAIEESVRVQALIIKELSPFVQDSTDIEYVNFNTTPPSPESFQKQLDKANSDPEIKAIIAPGFLGSQFIYKNESFTKPTFLAWVVDPNLVGNEIKNNTPNLYWLSTRNDVETTFKTIVQVIGQKPVTLVADNATATLGKTFFEGLKKKAQKFGIEFSVTLLDQSKPFIKQVDPKVALALVPPMRNGTADLIREIQAANIPVFTFEGPKIVEQGAMMTDIVDANESLIARSIALDIFGLLQGEKIEPGPRWLESEHHLTLNVSSAQQMGIDLPIEALSSATVVGFANINTESITLENAFQWVLDKNPSLSQSRNNIELAEESVIQARSLLYPQLDASLSHTRFSDSGNTVETGGPDQNTRATVNFSQLIYSVADRTDHEVAKLNKKSRQYLDDANNQNLVINALNVFLQVLISEATLSAQEENVRLARSNLSMAQKRVKLGSGTAGDVYNSEASIATANSDLLAARIRALESRRSLMDLSNTEFDENAVFDDVGLDHPSIAASHLLVQPLLETLSGIQKLAAWSSKQAVEESPNLHASMVTMDSNRLQINAADKGRYTPEVRLVGQAYSYLGSSTGSSGASFDDVDDVSLSINVSVPLWTSGRNTSLLRQAHKQLLDSELEYLAGKNTTQVNARNAVYTLAQAWQDIKLGKVALSSAEKSLEINQRSYASGAITIENLQSIQNTYIAALNSDKTNLYQYIQALGNWQLQVSAVSYLMEPISYEQWSTGFQTQLSELDPKYNN